MPWLELKVLEGIELRLLELGTTGSPRASLFPAQEKGDAIVLSGTVVTMVLALELLPVAAGASRTPVRSVGDELHAWWVVISHLPTGLVA